ncbi:MAG: SDR family oxidoreductase [Candidatus Omnitrophota bacterium]
MAKCLVTGGAGFIGSHVVDGLVAAGHQVRVLDNFSTGLERNLSHLNGKIEIYRDDVRHRDAVRRAVEGCDYVFHLAAVRAVYRSVDDPSETNDINITGTLNVLLSAKEKGARRVIFTSSSAVYGNSKRFPTRESDPLEPESPYGASKIMGEYYCRLFHQLYGLETVVLRYFNVYGPRQNPESKYSMVVPIFIECLLKGTPPEIHWDGKQSRDFLYVDNVVEGNLKAMRAVGVSGEAFNIGTQEEFSVLDIYHTLEKVLGRHVEPVYGPRRPGDVRRTLADIGKAKKKLGFKVQTRFKEGLAKTAQWFVESGSFKAG